jgi:RNA polymerase sigma-70 factor (ECF subfamily)
MHELALERPAARVSLDDGLEQEFQACLAEATTLAFRVAFAVLRNREDAEDVAQEAIAQAYRHFPKLRERGRFRAWLVRVAWRMAINRRRADARRATRDRATVPAAPAAAADDMVLSREVQEHVWREVDRLPDRLRSVITLTAMDGHDVRRVAELLAVPEGTVKSRLFQARKILMQRLRWLVDDTV